MYAFSGIGGQRSSNRSTGRLRVAGSLALYLGVCRLGLAFRLETGFFGGNWIEEPVADATFGASAAIVRLLGKDLLFELTPGAHTVQAHHPRQRIPRPPIPGAVTVAVTHIPVSMDNRWLVSWVDAMGGNAAIFADVRPSLPEHGACRNIGYVTFASNTAASRFLRHFRSAGDCGECLCDASWAGVARQGLQTQLRGVVFRRKTAPMARDALGEWALVERLPFTKPDSTLLDWTFRHSPEMMKEREYTTVLVEGLPDEYTNAHLVAWFNRLGDSGLHANFARLIPSIARGNLTKAIVNFDNHAEAEAFIRHVRGKDASPCAVRSHSSYLAVWAPPARQGLAVNLAKIPSWFGDTLFRDVGGVWQKLWVDPFSDVATGLRLRGGAQVRVSRPRACSYSSLF